MADHFQHLFESEPAAQAGFHAQVSDAVLQAALIAGSGEGLQSVLDVILDQLGRVVTYDSASIILFSAGGSRVITGRGFPHECVPLDWSLPVDDPKLACMERTRQPVVIDDVHLDPDWVLLPGTEYVRSWIGAPLLSRGRMIGSLNVDKKEPGYYTAEDAQLVLAFANQAAVVIENARLIEAERARAAQLRLVGNISQRVLSILEPEALLDYAVKAIQSEFDYYFVDAFLVDPGGEYVVFQTSSSAEHAQMWRDQHLRFAIGREGITGHVAATGQPYLSNDVAQDPLYIADKLLPDTRSELCVPIRAGNRILGVLDLNSQSLNAFDDQDLFVTQSLTDQLALGLENARLFAAERRSRLELKSIQATAALLSADVHLDTLLHRIVAEAALAFRADATSLMMWTPDGEALTVVASQGLSAEYARRQIVLRQRAEAGIPQGGPLGPMYVENLVAAPFGVPELVAQEGIHSVLIIPLVSQSRVRGVLNVYSKGRARTFSPADIDLAEAFAAHATVAIENASLYEELSHHLEEVVLLNNVAVAATSTLDFDDVVRRSMAALLGMPQFERANVLLLDPAAAQLSLHPALASTDRFLKDARMVLPLGRGICGRVAMTGLPARVNDVRQDPDYVAGYPDTLSEIAVPLRVGDRIIGVLDAQCSRQNAYSEADERLLVTLAGQLSTVMDNARLFEETQQRVRELTALSQVSQALNEARDLPTILSVVLEKAFGLLNSQEGSILLIDPPGGDRLRMVAERGLGAELMSAFNSRPVLITEGTYRRALTSGRIVEVADTTSDVDFLHDVGSRAGSITNVPLITEHRAIGLIAMDGLPRDDMTRRLLTALAAMAAVAIDKERLHQETADRLAEVSTLYTLATQITGSLSLARVLDSIVTILKLTIDCRACCIFLADPALHTLRLEACSGLPGEWHTRAVLEGRQGIGGRLLGEGRSVYIADTWATPGTGYFDPEARSVLLLPLLVRNQVIGALGLDDTRPDAFGDEMRLLTIAAAQAAVAIEDAQLYESLQASYGHLEKAYEALRELDRMKSELVQNISHELRTPLTFVKGYVELLQDGDLGPLNQQQRTALDIVANKASVLSRLVDDILTLQYTSRDQMHLCVLSLGSLGEAALLAAAASAADIDITLRAEIPGDLPPIVGDEQRLGQVLDNLLSNALKFSRPGAAITLRMRAGDAFVRTEVEDQGIGIPAEKLAHIFERFYQVDGSMTRRFGGTGLGLAIVKQIVEVHGGQVGVTSEQGRGSCFYFTLPVAPAGAPARAVSSE
jgi:GAF domain-containing protein